MRHIAVKTLKSRDDVLQIGGATGDGCLQGCIERGQRALRLQALRVLGLHRFTSPHQTHGEQHDAEENRGQHDVVANVERVAAQGDRSDHDRRNGQHAQCKP